MSERFAIYYAPEAQHPLWRKAAEWLGRDPLTGFPLHPAFRSPRYTEPWKVDYKRWYLSDDPAAARARGEEIR